MVNMAEYKIPQPMDSDRTAILLWNKTIRNSATASTRILHM